MGAAVGREASQCRPEVAPGDSGHQGAAPDGGGGAVNVEVTRSAGGWGVGYERKRGLVGDPKTLAGATR